MTVYARGVDISSYQHPPDRLGWTEAKAAGWSFVLVKATEGATYANPYFRRDVADARAAGLAVGAYHWVSPRTDADAQVANAVEALAPVLTGGDLPVALDFEQSGATHAQLDAIRAGLRAQGWRTMTYTYPSFWTANGEPGCPRCAADPLWFASYSDREPAPPKPWSQVAIWQYAGTSETVPGLPGANDANRALVPLNILTEAPPAPPSPITEDDMRIIYAVGRPTVLIYGGGFKPLASNAEVEALKAASVPVARVSQGDFDLLIGVSRR